MSKTPNKNVLAMMADGLVAAGVLTSSDLDTITDEQLAELFYDFTEPRGL